MGYWLEGAKALYSLSGSKSQLNGNLVAHSHILNHCEWSLARLNGIVRAKAAARTTDRDIESAIDSARRCGATEEQIKRVLESLTRLRS